MTEKFTSELAFEHALVKALQEQYGWDDGLLDHPTPEDLVKNWQQILFENNNTVDQLNGCPLTDDEMNQVMGQIAALRTPARLNGFINGRTVTIKRTNPEDTLHMGKAVSLKIYDRREIAGGESRYQIAEQPYFPTASPVDKDRRGDLMLLINGMSVIHIELKRSGASCQQAVNQIEKYSHEQVFTGICSLVQMFVAMQPEETKYFANPGPYGEFNPKFQFHWGDVNNEPMNDWRDVAGDLLSIPMAHQMIGFYSVADGSDGVLKVMRSYQYYAASRISDAVAKHKWGEDDIRGGYIWHTTGSGKTLTSYKAAQLISDSGKADKVVFLLDRRELSVQSLDNYRNFVGVDASKEEREAAVQATEDTRTLESKLKSNDKRNTLIVSSIQKMSRIRNGAWSSQGSGCGIDTRTRRRCGCSIGRSAAPTAPSASQCMSQSTVPTSPLGGV